MLRDLLALGNIDVYALAEYVEVPKLGISTDNDLRSGNSFAAPQVAGLVAYLMTAPSVAPFTAARVAMQAKTRVINLARARPVAGAKVIYNGIRELFCFVLPPPPPRSMKARGKSLHDPTTEQDSPIVRRATRSKDSVIVYGDGQWTDPSDAEGVSHPLLMSPFLPSADPLFAVHLQGPQSVPGFSISAYLPLQGNPTPPKFIAFSANRLGKCASRVSGFQVTVQGWLYGPDIQTVIKEPSEFDYISWNLEGNDPNPATVPDWICGTARRLHFTKIQPGNYSKQTNHWLRPVLWMIPQS